MVDPVNVADLNVSGAGLTAGAVLAGDTALKPAAFIEETFPRSSGAQINCAALSTGRVTLTGIWIPQGTVVTNISYFSATTALATGTIQWFALYNSSLALLRQTADGTNTAWAANAKRTTALTTPYTTTYTGVHYLAIMITASTVPTLVGASLMSATGPNAELPVLDIIGDSSCTATAPATVTQASVSLLRPYAAIS